MDDIFSYEMQFLAFEHKPYIKKRKLENPICLSYISFGPLECIFCKACVSNVLYFAAKVRLKWFNFLYICSKMI